jgi:hypothetical protein
MSANQIIDSMRSKTEEQQHLLLVLNMWEEVKTHGIDPEEVAAFGFNDEYVDAAIKNEWRKRGIRNSYDYQKMVFCRQYHNYVRMKDNSVVVLKYGIRRPEYRGLSSDDSKYQQNSSTPC